MFFKKKNKDSYTLGKEIKIDKKKIFAGYSLEKDSVGICKARLFFAIYLFVFAYIIIAVRVFNLCIVPNLNTAISQTSEEFPETRIFFQKPIKRADIMDSSGVIVATSLPTVNLFVNTKKLLDVKASALALHEAIPDMSYESILKIFKKDTSFSYIKRNLTPSQQHQINALGIPGLDFENGEKRVYPYENLFAHILGVTNIDNAGVSGVESGLNTRLTESDIPLNLTINSGVQYTIREEMKKAIKKFSAVGGVAILMDVSNGEVISMVSLPDYNPNQIKSSTNKAMFNFGVAGVYEPGSVFKVFNTAMGLDYGVVNKNSKLDATQPLKMKYNTIKDYRGQNRILTLEEVLIHSSNIGSARIALDVGKKRQREFLEKLGMFNPLDIPMIEKGKPIVPSRWGEETIATVGYGYGLSVSPLHIITAFVPVVNGGIYYAPNFIKGKKDEGFRVISKKTSNTMIDLLRSVVVEGSGKNANVFGYDVIGKTGTANKLVNGKYVEKKVMATFISAFPAKNPKYALYVMLDEPKATKDTWGFVTSGWNTVPTAGSIITAIAPQLHLPANFMAE